jgi:hypothetical protein
MQGNALVAVKEWVVLYEVKEIGGRHFEQVAA